MLYCYCPAPWCSQSKPALSNPEPSCSLALSKVDGWQCGRTHLMPHCSSVPSQRAGGSLPGRFCRHRDPSAGTQILHPSFQSFATGWFVLKYLYLILTFYSLSEIPLSLTSVCQEKTWILCNNRRIPYLFFQVALGKTILSHFLHL